VGTCLGNLGYLVLHQQVWPIHAEIDGLVGLLEVGVEIESNSKLGIPI
jgi:hypothetical protein